MQTPACNISFPLFDLDFCFVKGGVFNMGDNSSKFDYEKPAHSVQLSDYYIGKFPVTKRLWQAVMGSNPSVEKGERYPVEKVSWNDAQSFLNKLNQSKEVQDYLHQLDLFSAKFCLPTEAEWEYAARGGKYSQGYTYAGSDKLKQVGWYGENSGGKTKEVGLLLANELGIYDMSGNVMEWCSDWFEEEYYKECQGKGVIVNPPGPDKGTSRVLRGGSYFSYPLYCCSVYRFRRSPELRDDFFGFRLVLSFQLTEKPDGFH